MQIAIVVSSQQQGDIKILAVETEIVSDQADLEKKLANSTDSSGVPTNMIMNKDKIIRNCSQSVKVACNGSTGCNPDVVLDECKSSAASRYLIDIIVPFTILFICASYMFMGCAGHRRQVGESGLVTESQMPEGEQVGQLNPDGGIAPISKMDQQPVSSIAGYQSQTSEILVGPGENLNNLSNASSVASAHSQASRLSNHTGVSRASNLSRVGSNLQSSSNLSHAGSKHGSTLSSSVSGKPGAGRSSVLSILSRVGNSNIQSTLSSNAASSTHSRAGSNLQSSNISSMAAGARSRPPTSNRASTLSSPISDRSRLASSHMASSHLASSQAGSSHAAGSSIRSSASPSRANLSTRSRTAQDSINISAIPSGQSTVSNSRKD